MRLMDDMFNKPRFDCTSMSLSAQANGLYNFSFKVYLKKGLIPFTAQNTPSFNICVSKYRQFQGFITAQNVSPSVEYNNISEWSCTAVGFVIEDPTCFAQVNC